MLILGPALVIVATGLISFVLYVGVNCVLPLYGSPYSLIRLASTVFTAFLGINILYNYYHCVRTNPGTHDDISFKNLIEQAVQAGDLPPNVLNNINSGMVGSDDDSDNDDDDTTTNNNNNDTQPLLNHQIAPNNEMRNRVANDMNTTNSMGVRSQIINTDDARNRKDEPAENPYAWGHCKKSNGPKPPRAHYDRVTRKLVLKMDHYCPWMFNVVGWRNYRYFFLFLLWLWTGTLFAILMTLFPFLAVTKRNGNDYGFPQIPSKDRSNISLMFIICASIAIAISFLFFWHVYLMLSGQTTIEFYINKSKRNKSLAHGKLYFNPFDLGYKKNWQHVMGTSNFFISILPSNRAPHGLPWPSLRFKTVNKKRDVV